MGRYNDKPLRLGGNTGVSSGTLSLLSSKGSAGALGPSNRFGALHLGPGDELLNDLNGNEDGKKTLYPIGTDEEIRKKKSPWR
ncbi:MAG: hypothetical protein ACHQ1D_01605 [Nitrososphaerales archaeon]|jgi:hypothetical protein